MEFWHRKTEFERLREEHDRWVAGLPQDRFKNINRLELTEEDKKFLKGIKVAYEDVRY